MDDINPRLMGKLIGQIARTMAVAASTHLRESFHSHLQKFCRVKVHICRMPTELFHSALGKWRNGARLHLHDFQAASSIQVSLK